jgi:hypothetical protein
VKTAGRLEVEDCAAAKAHADIPTAIADAR